ncbi:hypothetical protein SLS60_007049 [Paraconiothyrium brasiliense]|uniref:Heterokaryon incompatibility domain-containing protein n=1 Tax=Paraconiothyrium brasiliense TaxID=300254 RepID=A0ABR3R8A0_9PLEO
MRLKPGSDKEPLCCELYAEDLDNPPVYEAISYVWGSPQGSVPLDCDGQVLLITPSLNDALYRIRHQSLDKTVWADAVCINQRSLTEKAHQVNQMALVYERASRVMICLGVDGHGDAEEAFEFIKETNRHFETGMEIHGHIDNVPLLELNHPITNPSRWIPLQRLFLQTWFSRVWIIQEVGLAATAVVLYGKHSIPWSDMIQFILIEHRRPDLKAVPVVLRIGRTIDAFNLIWCNYGNATSWRTERPYIRYLSGLPHHRLRKDLFNVLLTGARFDATDGRDHVYAFLGHPSASFSETKSTIIEADYKVTKEELYRHVATTLLERMGSLLLLSAAEQTEETLASDFPSWIPRWDTGNTAVILSPFPGQAHYYDASLFPETRHEYIARPSHLDRVTETPVSESFLHVRGFTMARVDVNSEVMYREAYDRKSTNEAEKDDRFINPIEAAWTIAKSSQPPNTLYATILEAFSLTITAGLDKLRKPAAHNIATHLSNFASFCSSKLSHKLNSEIAQHNPGKKGEIQTANGDERHFSVQARQACHGRRFFVTDGGLFGLGPAAMRTGDMCCVFVGARVPFVVRSTGISRRYKVIGECYLHGFMEGEVVPKWKRGGVEIEEFSLS